MGYNACFACKRTNAFLCISHAGAGHNAPTWSLSGFRKMSGAVMSVLWQLQVVGNFRSTHWVQEKIPNPFHLTRDDRKGFLKWGSAPLLVFAPGSYVGLQKGALNDLEDQ
jgi:hypothetical protein